VAYVSTKSITVDNALFLFWSYPQEVISITAKLMVDGKELDTETIPISTWSLAPMSPYGFYATTPQITFKGLTANTVLYSDKMTIEWRLKGTDYTGKAVDDEICTSLHTIYVTKGEKMSGWADAQEANGAKNCRSFFHIGCKQANGCTDEQAIFNGIWNYFSTKNVKTYDNKLLTYYQTGHYATAPVILLAQHDGDCAAWAGLLQKVVHFQGISNHIIALKTANTWFADANGTLHLLDGAGFSVNTKVAQGGTALVSRFQGHMLVSYNNKLYDPSYGTGPWSTYIPSLDAVRQFQDQSLSRIYFADNNYVISQLDNPFSSLLLEIFYDKE